MKIEAIMTTFNEEKNIKRAIISLFNQTLSPRRLIIVDAGSRDGTLQKIKVLKKKYPIKLVIKKGCNRSQGRNEAIKITNSPYIFSLNADVKLEKDCIKNLANILKKDSKIGGVGGIQLFPKSQNIIAKAIWHLPGMSEISEVNIPSIKRKDVEVRNIPCECCLWRRKALIDVGLFNENLNWGEDPELHYRMRKKGWKLIATRKAKFEHYYKDTIKGFAKQQFFYGVGGFYLLLHSPSAAKEILRGKIYLCILLPFLFLLALFIKVKLWVLILIGLGGLIFSSMVSITRIPRKRKKIKFLILVWSLQIIKHLSNLIGFYFGSILYIAKRKLGV